MSSTLYPSSEKRILPNQQKAQSGEQKGKTLAFLSKMELLVNEDGTEKVVKQQNVKQKSDVTKIFNDVFDVYDRGSISTAITRAKNTKQRQQIIDLILNRREEIKNAEQIMQISRCAPLVSRFMKKIRKNQTPSSLALSEESGKKSESGGSTPSSKWKGDNQKDNIIMKGLALSVFFKQKEPVFALGSNSSNNPAISLSKNPHDKSQILTNISLTKANSNEKPNEESKASPRLNQITKDSFLQKNTLPANIKPGSTEAKLFLINLNTVSENSKALEAKGKIESREKANALLKDFQKMNLASHFKSKSLNQQGFNGSEVNTFNFNRSIQQKQAQSKIESLNSGIKEQAKVLSKILHQSNQKEILEQVENDIAQFAMKELQLKKEEAEQQKIKSSRPSTMKQMRGSILFEKLMQNNFNQRGSILFSNNQKDNPFLNISNLSHSGPNSPQIEPYQFVSQRGSNMVSPIGTLGDFSLDPQPEQITSASSFFAPQLTYRFPEIKMLEFGAQQLFLKEQEKTDLTKQSKNSRCSTSVQSKRQSKSRDQSSFRPGIIGENYTISTQSNRFTTMNDHVQFQENDNKQTPLAKEQNKGFTTERRNESLSTAEKYIKPGSANSSINLFNSSDRFQFKSPDSKDAKQFHFQNTSKPYICLGTFQQVPIRSYDSLNAKQTPNLLSARKIKKQANSESERANQIKSLNHIKTEQNSLRLAFNLGSHSVKHSPVNSPLKSILNLTHSKSKDNLNLPISSLSQIPTKRSQKSTSQNVSSHKTVRLTNPGSFQSQRTQKPFRLNQQMENCKHNGNQNNQSNSDLQKFLSFQYDMKDFQLIRLHESHDNDNSCSFASFTEIKLDQLYKHSTKIQNQLQFIEKQSTKVKRFDLTQKFEAQRQRNIKDLTQARQEIEHTFNRKFKKEKTKFAQNEEKSE